MLHGRGAGDSHPLCFALAVSCLLAQTSPSLIPTPSQHCILFSGRWQEVTVGPKLGCVALLSRLLSHPGKDFWGIILGGWDWVGNVNSSLNLPIRSDRTCCGEPCDISHYERLFILFPNLCRI